MQPDASGGGAAPFADRKFAPQLVAFITLAIVAGVTLMPLAGATGWLQNHESIIANRIDVYVF